MGFQSRLRPGIDPVHVNYALVTVSTSYLSCHFAKHSSIMGLTIRWISFFIHFLLSLLGSRMPHATRKHAIIQNGHFILTKRTAQGFVMPLGLWPYLQIADLIAKVFFIYSLTYLFTFWGWGCGVLSGWGGVGVVGGGVGGGVMSPHNAVQIWSTWH